MICIQKTALCFGQPVHKASWGAQSHSNKPVSSWKIVARDHEGFGVEGFHIAVKDKILDPNPCYPTPYVLKLATTMIGPSKKKG